jgi:hypothetical protein
MDGQRVAVARVEQAGVGDRRGWNRGGGETLGTGVVERSSDRFDAAYDIALACAG